MPIIIKKQLKIYSTNNGKAPFIEWLESLKERLDRVALGNLGDHKYIGDNIYELRLDFGSGYRVYFVNQENDIILLLCGGNKSSQKNDVKKAKKYLHDYLF